MPDMDEVQKEICKQCKENILLRIQSINGKVDDLADVTEKRLDAHSSDIKNLTAILERQVALQEVQTKQVTLSEERLYLLQQSVGKTPEPVVESSQFWKEKWFSWVVAVACIIILAVTGVAIGVNLMGHANIVAP